MPASDLALSGRGKMSAALYLREIDGEDTMTVAFRDFTPTGEKTGFFSSTYESLQDCLQRANRWMAAENPDVINIETVVLPNLVKNQVSESPVLVTSGEYTSWHQIVRVWYKT